MERSVEKQSLLATPPALPKGRGISGLGGKLQGNQHSGLGSAEGTPSLEAAVLLVSDSGMTQTEVLFHAPTSKEKLLPGTKLQSKETVVIALEGLYASV